MAMLLLLSAGSFGAADYDELADGPEDPGRALLYRAQDAMDVDRDEFEEVEEVVDDEDVDIMFAFDDDGKSKKKAVKKVKKSKPTNMLPDGGLGLDAADDPEGYYTPTLGETLDGKYHVFSVIGKGMFTASTALLSDAAPKREVAVKIMRTQETTYKSSQREAALLAKLNAADPDDTQHAEHLGERLKVDFCIIMEGLGWNLREILKSFGKDVGLSIAAVNAYMLFKFSCMLFLIYSMNPNLTSLFQGPELFKKESITHTDIKPDNILISNNTTTLKVCDLRSPANASSAESTSTPYLVSRF
ncbi:hypothetical protein DL96DRAFT_1805453 [Flagelloscypha sp. PMI_526]|nr:hypothetical protein DL96DRAFT_1805453 [Flagelloscypha sp. PMI_526]